MASQTEKRWHGMLNSPFKWAGGKSRLRKYIVPMIPPHACYVEPFAGAAWVLFGKARSEVEVLNDIDQELTTFFRVLRDQPEELIASFQWEIASRGEFDRLALLETSQLSDVQRAHRFYYLIMAGWGGEGAYPRFQTSIRDGGHGNRLIGALKTLEVRLRPIHSRLRTVLIENLDWKDCIDRYDSNSTFLYLDPPYLGNGVNYKFNLRDEDQHLTIAERLRTTKGLWLLSAYDTEAMRNMFAGYSITPVSAFSGMKASKASQQTGYRRTLNREVLITNYDPPMQETPLSRIGSDLEETEIGGRQSAMFQDGSLVREEDVPLETSESTGSAAT